MLATPKSIEETRMLRETSELQYRILKSKCDQALAERDELVAFKVSTQKKIEELEERRAAYELKFPPELDVDAVTRRLDSLPPLDEMQTGAASPKASRFAEKRNLQTALRQVLPALFSTANATDTLQAACTKALLFQQIDAFRDVSAQRSPTAAAIQNCERELELCLENVRQTNRFVIADVILNRSNCTCRELDDMVYNHSLSTTLSKPRFSSSPKSPLASLSRAATDVPPQRSVKLSPLGADR